MLSKRNIKPSLCLIVWNELEGCHNDVPLLPMHLFHEVYAIDGGSSDGTVDYLQSHAIQVYKQPKPSLNAAYNYAVEKCTGDSLVIFFPKGTIDPNCASTMIKHLENGYDLVIASRNISGGRNEEDNYLIKPRKWGVEFLSLTASLLWRREGTRIHDVLHGVKAFTIEAYRQMNIAEMGITIDLEMVIRAYRLNIPRIECPVTETRRLHGETMFKILPTAKRLALFLWAELFRSV